MVKAADKRVDELVEAAQAQDGAEGISTLLALGSNADVNAVGQLGITPLVAAAEMGAVDNLRALLAAGADVNQQCHGTYPLRAALQAGDFECVDLLISHGADVNLDARVTPLVAACQVADPEAITLLLSRGAKIDHMTRDGMTALMVAVREDRREAVRQLLRHGADPSIAVKDTGKTALDIAQELVLPEVVSLLMQQSITSSAEAAEAETEARQQQGMREAVERFECDMHKLQQDSDQGRKQVAAKVAELQAEKLELIKRLGLKTT